jgi:hypothetical protein
MKITAQIHIKASAKLKTEKYFTQIKSTTKEFTILSYPFQIAHARIKPKAKSIILSFFFFSSVK